ncbi:MAG: bifunctional hydroxymethylpyrimidine kinase/phosphomethylpyrimidine kinase [Gammaproteobacteria bacterium RIFCSPHIGHO2_12_FULL_35_23]|nr:MAG: bifunctional hydroxymethylpyrimidine kinase/phosphomethylpyrimidine kinase [Gammaproteobacteria bacterium RIFCSPHIGHO2_12_FULL_35_23]
MTKRYVTVLAIAGSDCSGGAGIQADIKTISANGAYAVSVITALTAQNTLGVHQIQTLPEKFITAQLEAVFTDIYIDTIKIGMLHNSDVINCVQNAIKRYQPRHIVLDPVMVAKDGARLINIKVIELLKEKLFPIATLITPNIPEAEILSGHKIFSKKEMLLVAKDIALTYKVNVLIKGGHLENKKCHDLLFSWKDQMITWFSLSRINTKNTHGTGCSLSSAIATFVAQGSLLTDAIKQAKEYVNAALLAGKDYALGAGQGPVHHFYQLEKIINYNN